MADDDNSHRMIVYPDRDAWEASRRDWIGASEVPILLGVSYVTPLQLWLQRTGRIEREPESARFRIGHALEPIAADLAGEALRELDGAGTQRIVAAPPPSMHRIPAPRIHLRLGVTLDLWTHPTGSGKSWADPSISPPPQGAEPLDLKTVTPSAFSHWPETGEPHPHAAVQVAVQVAALAAPRGWAFALVGFDERRALYPIEPPPQAFLDLVAEAIESFWRCLETDTPPPAGAGDSDALRVLYPRAERKTILLPHEFVTLAERRRQIDALTSDLATEREQIDAQFKQALGVSDAGIIQGTELVARWSNRTRTEPVRMEPKVITYRAFSLATAKKSDWKALDAGVMALGSADDPEEE